jgi:hypothetical protein
VLRREGASCALSARNACNTRSLGGQPDRRYRDLRQTFIGDFSLRVCSGLARTLLRRCGWQLRFLDDSPRAVPSYNPDARLDILAF